MYIVRWLTGHPMIAVWVLGAIAILLSYGSTDRKDQKVEKEIVTSEASAVSTKDTSSTDVIKNEDNVKDENLDEEKTVIVDDNSESINTVKTATNEEKGDSLTKPAATNANELPSKSLDKTSTPDVEGEGHDSNQIVEEKPKGRKNEQASSLNLSETDKKINLNNNDSDVADLGQLSSDEMLKMAREAYWNNGLDEAAKIYQQLIKREPKIIEHRGELGNVYWRQGYPKKAAEIYSEIAIPMIENGNSNRVANMIGFIGLFYPDRASVIHDRLQNANIKLEESSKAIE